MEDAAAAAVAAGALPLYCEANANDFEALLASVGSAQVVLLGESSHGTHEFYAHRVRIAQLLIEQKGFSMVCIEGDWPSTCSVNRYIKFDDHGGGTGDVAATAMEATAEFADEFPTWMWRNRPTLELVEWLKERNVIASFDDSTEPVSMYGLDLYSLHRSAAAVIAYLDAVDPGMAAVARDVYRPFELYSTPQAYGEACCPPSGAIYCEGGEARIARIQREVEGLLAKLQARNRDDYYGLASPQEQFSAEQNAEIVVAAEEYYRAQWGVGGGHANGWNTRDQHMANTVVRLRQHHEIYAKCGGFGAPKTIIFAHNSHIGDARATAMGGGVAAAVSSDDAAAAAVLDAAAEWNLGQMCRQSFGAENVYLLGFSTNSGTVTAAPKWGSPPRCERLSTGLPGTMEALLHEAQLLLEGEGDGAMLVIFRAQPAAATTPPRASTCSEMRSVLATPREHRFVGVVYHHDTPAAERASHYIRCNLADEFDALVHTRV